MIHEKKLRPMLYQEGHGAFHSKDYLFEIDPAGARCLAYLSKNETTLRSERNMDLLPLFPELSGLHTLVSACCILDGQLVVLQDAMPDVRALLNRISALLPPMVQAQAEAHPALFIASDILFQGETSLLDKPLTERRAALRDTVSESPILSLSHMVDAAGAAFYELTRQQDFAGLLARRKDGLYLPGEASGDALRIGGRMSELFIACGATLQEDSASLLLGRFEGLSLAYRGKLSPGVTKEAVSGYTTTPHCPFGAMPKGVENAAWFDPLKLCLVRRSAGKPGWSLEAFL